MKIGNHKTVYVSFLGKVPDKLAVYKNNGELEYERFLNPELKNIKFNIVNGGDFYFNVPIKINKVVELEKNPIKFTLPTYERNRIKDFVIVHNKNIGGSPARIFTNEGVIETGSRFFEFSKPMRIFFLLHEIGHFYYSTEEYCDIFAAYFFLDMGYNMSTCIYCLTNVLKDSANNEKRIKYVYDKILNG